MTKHRLHTILLTLTLVLLLAGAGWGADYYMRADGTAANKAAATGPESDPSACMSISTHNNEIYSAGDEIVVSGLGGVYDVSSTRLTCQSDGVRYTGSNNPVFDGHEAQACCWNIGTHSDITIANITFQNATARAIDYHYGGSNAADNITISNSTIRSSFQGLRLKGSNYTITDSIIANNTITGIRVQDCDGLTFTDNYIYNNGRATGTNNDDGFECDGCKNLYIANNTFHTNISAHGSGLDVNDSAAVKVSNGTIEKNRFYDNSQYGLTLKGYDNGTTTIQANLLYNNHRPIYLDLTWLDVLLYSNTVFNATGYETIKIAGDSSVNAALKNNLFFSNATTVGIYIDGTATIASDYNCWYGFDTFGNDDGVTFSFSDWQATKNQGANSFTSDPLFTDAANADFTLQSGSPAIDAGTDLGDAYAIDFAGLDQDEHGSGWEIGAYVYDVPVIARRGWQHNFRGFGGFGRW